MDFRLLHLPLILSKVMPESFTVATICARGGSKGVPGKNIRPLFGRPLISYTIQQALEHKEIDRVFVSTDSPQIADVARDYGAEVPFLRPHELATDSAPKIPVIQHLVDWIDDNIATTSRIIDLDPTSPLRDSVDITSCLSLLGEDTDVVITGYASDKNPYFNMVELSDNGFAYLSKELEHSVVTRQSAPRVYAMNASIYCWHRASLKNGIWNGNAKLHVMPRERSIDVDHEIDFQIVEFLMKNKMGAL